MGASATFTCLARPDEQADLSFTWTVDGPQALSLRQLMGPTVEITFPMAGMYKFSVMARAPSGETSVAEHVVAVASGAKSEPADGVDAEVDEERKHEENGALAENAVNGDIPTTAAHGPSPDGTAQVPGYTSTLTQRLAPQGFRVVGLGDLNGNGMADLVALTPDNNRLLLYSGHGDGTFSEQGSVGTGIAAERILVADFTGNRLGDVIAISWTSRRAILLRSVAPFELALPMPLVVPALAWDAWAVQLSDRAGNELVWLTEGLPVVWSFLDRGAVIEWNRAPASLAFSMPEGSGPFSWTPVWVDGSIGSAWYESASREIRLSTSSNHTVIALVPPGMSLLQIAVADLSGDGKASVLGLDQRGQLQVFLGEDAGWWTARGR